MELYFPEVKARSLRHRHLHNRRVYLVSGEIRVVPWRGLLHCVWPDCMWLRLSKYTVAFYAHMTLGRRSILCHCWGLQKHTRSRFTLQVTFPMWNLHLWTEIERDGKGVFEVFESWIAELCVFLRSLNSWFVSRWMRHMCVRAGWVGGGCSRLRIVQCWSPPPLVTTLAIALALGRRVCVGSSAVVLQVLHWEYL